MSPNNQAYFRSRKAPGPLAVKVGDTVAYTRYFLKSIGMPPTDDMWRQRGTVAEVNGNYARVLWDGEDEPRGVLTNNLAHPGANLRHCE